MYFSNLNCEILLLFIIFECISFEIDFKCLKLETNSLKLVSDDFNWHFLCLLVAFSSDVCAILFLWNFYMCDFVCASDSFMKYDYDNYLFSLFDYHVYSYEFEQYVANL